VHWAFWGCPVFVPIVTNKTAFIQYLSVKYAFMQGDQMPLYKNPPKLLVSSDVARNERACSTGVYFELSELPEVEKLLDCNGT
jgi:hypothetical protein